jgi:hypothetical protein
VRKYGLLAAGVVAVALVAVAMLWAAGVLRVKTVPLEPVADDRPPGQAAKAVDTEPAGADEGFVLLFNGKDLTG